MNFDQIFSKENLQANFNSWKQKFSHAREPDPDCLARVQRLHSTHTFGHEVVWENGNRFPYKDILFKSKGLLSQKKRESSGFYSKDEPKRDLGNGKELSDFIFAYLGVHDHYYSTNGLQGKDTLAVPAYGVFLPCELDEKEFTNGSRRDLSSPEIGEIVEEEFFDPRAARYILAHEVAHRYDGNFNYYWGNLEFGKNEPGYYLKQWTWKIELHYFQKVEVKEFAAILWPLKTIFRSETESFIDPIAREEISKFQSENPDIKVYYYSWKQDQAFHRFTWASFIVTDYYYKHSKLPEIDYFITLFKLEFS